MQTTFKLTSLADDYTQLLANSISVSPEDLTDNERKLIEKSFDLFKAKLEDIKILQDENKKITIDLLNMKSWSQDRLGRTTDEEE